MQPVNRVTVVATRIVGVDGSAANENLVYEHTKCIGQGSFGTVYLATLSLNKQDVAIKKVLQDRRFKNRELSIMKRLRHSNVVQLLYYFYTTGSSDQNSEVYLNLVMDFVPENVYKQVRYYSTQRQVMPLIFTKLYIYQLFRALNYIHKDNICHRDIKPQNLLCNPNTGILKLCDFGSAKQLNPEESNVSYICSRYYRAPELILCAIHYTCAIDVWSCGCVLGELLLNQPLFPGESGVDQLVEIIKILGTPSREQIDDMNPQAAQQFRFPPVRPHPWNRVFRQRTPQSAINLASVILEFSPQKRIQSIVALSHDFFIELRDPNQRLPNGAPLPEKELFHLSLHECSTLIDAQNSFNGGAGRDAQNIFATGVLNTNTSPQILISGINNGNSINSNANRILNNQNANCCTGSSNTVNNNNTQNNMRRKISSNNTLNNASNLSSNTNGSVSQDINTSTIAAPPALHHNTSMTIGAGTQLQYDNSKSPTSSLNNDLNSPSRELSLNNNTIQKYIKYLQGDHVLNFSHENENDENSINTVQENTVSNSIQNSQNSALQNNQKILENTECDQSNREVTNNPHNE